MASHGQHHSVHTTPGMPLAGMAMQQQQQPMPMHYTQQAQQPQMSMGGGGYGMPASQLQAQMQMQLQSQMHMQQVQKQRLFWQQQIQEVEQVNEFKNHQLPLARIKKIMKSDEDVKMIAAEAPVVFSKACEMFVLDLTLRSWGHTEENKRRTLQRNDIAGAVLQGDIFDFLVDIVPRDEPKEEEAGAQWGGVGENDVGVAGDSSLPYGSMYYPPMGEQVMAPQHMGQQPMGQLPMNPYMGPAAQT